VDPFVMTRRVEQNEEAHAGFTAARDVMALHACAFATDAADGTNGFRMYFLTGSFVRGF
jgi:hypothetical protein